MSYPALTTAFAAPAECTQWNLDNCAILPDYTSNGVEQSACTGDVFPTQACGEPQASCYPSTDAEGEPVMTYAGSVCPDGMEAAETSTGPDGVWCCPSGLSRFGDSFCTGTSSSGTFIVHRTDDAGACQVTSTVTFGPETTGFFDYIYSTFDSSVTLPYPLDRMAMEITANGIYLVNEAGATPTPTPSTSESSSESESTPTGTTSSSSESTAPEPTPYPTESSVYPTESSSGAPAPSPSTSAPSGSTSTESETSYSSQPPPEESSTMSTSTTSPGEEEPTTSSGGEEPSPTAPSGTTTLPTGSSTPTPTPSPGTGAAASLDASASVVGGLLMAVLGYVMML